MTNILLVDALSAQHVGNAALVDSTLDQLKAQFPQAQFTILAFDPPSIADLCECRTIETLWAEPFSAHASKLGQTKWTIRESLWMVVNGLSFSIQDDNLEYVTKNLWRMMYESNHYCRWTGNTAESVDQ